jgi:hypothetical protein
MTTKTYTDQEIKTLFPKQAKTNYDIFCIADAINIYGLDITLKASKNKKAIDGWHVYWVARNYL